MDAKVCVWFILCEDREGLVFEVDILCLYVALKRVGFNLICLDIL